MVNLSLVINVKENTKNDRITCGNEKHVCNQVINKLLLLLL